MFDSRLCNNDMIESNKIKKTELLLIKKSQRFNEFVSSLRRERKERFSSFSLGSIEKGTKIGHMRHSRLINPSENIEDLSRIERIGYSNPAASRYQSRPSQKCLGDSSLRYKYRVSVGNRSFFHEYKLPSHCFLPAKQQLDKHLRQSRLISQQQIRINKLNPFQLGVQTYPYIYDDNDTKFISGQNGQRKWGTKNAKHRKEQQRCEEQSESNTNPENSKISFINEQQSKSQYIQPKKTNSKGLEVNDVSIQRRQLSLKQNKRYNPGQSNKSFIYGFDQMPSIPQNPQFYQKKIQQKRQPGKFHKRIPQRERLSDALSQELPLQTKW